MVCPKCRHGLSDVVTSAAQDDGVRVRVRICRKCGHKFWTAQDPEWLVPVAKRAYLGRKPIIKDF